MPSADEQRDRDRFDDLPSPPPMGYAPITQDNILVEVGLMRDAIRHGQVVQSTLIRVTRETNGNAATAATKATSLEQGLFGGEYDKDSGGIIGDLKRGQKTIRNLAWAILLVLVAGLFGIIAALATGHSLQVGALPLLHAIVPGLLRSVGT